MRFFQILVLGLIVFASLTVAGVPAEPAGAEAGEPKTPLVIGIFPRRNATLTSDLFSPLVDYLSRELNREVQLRTTKNFAAFWEEVRAGSYDIVHYNQYHYVESSDRYRVIAHNEEFGHGTISGAIYVRRDSGIHSLEQLRGRKILFGGGRDAMMSYIIPRYMLKQAGLEDSDFVTSFASSPPNAVLGVFYRQTDAGGAGDVVINLPVVKRMVKTEEVAILSRSEPVVHLPWVVRRDMPEELSERIRQLLITLKDGEEGRAILKTARITGLAPSEDHDYDRCREIIREVTTESIN